MNARPVSISHLVVGLVFAGIALMWAIGATTDADAPDLAAWGPAVLITAGALGLIATLVNARRGRTPAASYDDPTTAVDTDAAPEDKS